MAAVTYTILGEEHTLGAIGLALYHIAHNTQVSEGYTLEYVREVLSAASSYLCEYRLDSGPHYYPNPAKITEEWLKRVNPDQRKEWEEADGFVAECFYHGVEHSVPDALHPCPADAYVLCKCCDAGVNHCLRNGPTAV